MTLKTPVPFQDVPTTRIESKKHLTELVSTGKFPEAWLPFYEELNFFVARYMDLGFKVFFSIGKGLLRFELQSDRTTDLDRKLINRICQSIASSSARICMECGKHGFRRKNEEGWPCLCTTHYIEYATQLTTQENG